MENIRNHMTDTEKKVKKDKLVKRIKECFGKELSDVFTEKGVEKFYDPNTSVEFAEGMLDRAAIHLAVGETLGTLFSVVFGDAVEVLTEEELEAENEDLGFGDTSEEFQVYNSSSRVMYGSIFDSYEDAKRFVEEEALNSSYMLSDFKIVKVYD